MRPFGARCVPPSAQPGHSHTGVPLRGRRSTSGLTRIRLNRGESSFMTLHYGEADAAPASLTNTNDTRSTMHPSGKTGQMRVNEIITEKLTEAFLPESLRA